MARWVKSKQLMQIFKTATTPTVADGLRIGDLWVDTTSTAVVKICTAVGPVVFSTPSSGAVTSGLINQLSYYAAAGTTLSGLATANNGLLVTSATGVPSIGNAILADITVNSVKVGRGVGNVDGNTAVGVQALNGVNTGTGQNTAFGYLALTGNTSGANNTGVGIYSGLSNTTGSENTSVGSYSLGQMSAGLGNTAIGRVAFYYQTSGDGNTGLGYYAGSTVYAGQASITTGSYNTHLGLGATVATGGEAAVGTIAIGAGASANIASGTSSATNGSGIAIGSVLYPVGFRGDGTIYPSTTGAGFWRPKINGTAYMVPLLTDGATAWPAITTASITFSSTSGIIGTTTNDNAAAGSVGELKNSSYVTGVSLTSAVTTNLTSLALTAGDWDVWASFTVTPAATTTLNVIIAGIDDTTATLRAPNSPATVAVFQLKTTFTVGAIQILQTGTARLSLSGSATFYLNAHVVFGVSTLTAEGQIYARRRR